MPLLFPLKSGFNSACSFSAMLWAISFPIAGAAESPGDSIPAASKNPGESACSPITKSPPSSCARSPEKDVITEESGRFPTLREALFAISDRPSAVVAVSSLSKISSAVGPMSRFP